MQNILLATLTRENPLGVIWSAQPRERSCFWTVTSDYSRLGECEMHMRHQRWGEMGIKGKKFPWLAHTPLSWSLSPWSAVLIPHRKDFERKKGSTARQLKGKAQLNLHPLCYNFTEDKPFQVLLLLEAAEVGNLGSTGFGANFKYRKVMIGVEVGRGWVFFCLFCLALFQKI